MTNLKDRLQKRIKSSKELPIPRSYFVIKNLIIWSLGFLFFVFGILGTMQIFYFAQNLEILEFLIDMPFLAPKIIFIGFPIVWIIIAIIGIFFSEKSIEHTKKGYRLSKKWLILGILGTQIIVGGVLAQTSLSEKIEKKLRHIPHVFGNLEEQKQKLWQNPENGFLFGKFVREEYETLWIINDSSLQEWQLKIKDDTKYPRNKIFKKGESLRIRGKLLDKNKRIFEGKNIFPMNGRRVDYFKQMQRRIEHFPLERQKEIKAQRKQLRKKMENLDPEQRQEFREKQNKKWGQEFSRHEKNRNHHLD